MLPFVFIIVLYNSYCLIMATKSSLGKALIRDRFGNKKQNAKSSFLHTTELNDGIDFNKVNFKSVTEQSTLDEFIYSAKMAQTQFKAERRDVHIVTNNDSCPSAEEIERNAKIQMEYRSSLRVPRRPAWDASTTPQELDEMERQAFLEWRHSLSILGEMEGIIITPYERNLEFWRQLWRVIERSDVVVQIVDARNPLLFRCEDLEAYVKEVDSNKINVILINKADFLTESQRRHWLDYFKGQDLTIYFFSALNELEESEEELRETTDTSVLSRSQLLECFRNLGKKLKGEEELVTVGLIGYPNVGKSSTLNALLKERVVPDESKSKNYQAATSSTPGKTKHFQTIFIDEWLLLCDCPGLVMPNFVSSKADMITNGILPIDQMQDHLPPTAVVCKNIPRRLLENTYGIMLDLVDDEMPGDAPDPNRLLKAYAKVRGFMTHKGVPDSSRAARIILKDYVNGKLCYRYGPPSVGEGEYGSRPVVPDDVEVFMSPEEIEATKKAKMPKGMVDFVNLKKIETFHKSIDKKALAQEQMLSKKHFNKNKRTKLRRLYKDNYDSD